MEKTENSSDPKRTRTRSAFQLQPVGFYLVLAFFTLLSVSVAFLLPAPIGQDTPLHLFQVLLLSGDASASVGAVDVYTISRVPSPYGLWYWLTAGLCWLLPTDFALRFALALPALVTGLFLVSEGRRATALSSAGGLSLVMPWAGLLLFPLLYNLTHYWGFVPFELGAALLPWALRSHCSGCGQAKKAEFARAGSWSLLLLWAHTYIFLCYLVLTLCQSGLHVLRNKLSWKRVGPSAIPALATLALFVVWGATIGRDLAGVSLFPQRLEFWPPGHTLRHLALTIGGMRSGADLYWPSLLGWCVVILVALASTVRAMMQKEKRGEISSSWAFLGVLCLIGAFALPSWILRYAFFNVRLLSLALPLFVLALVPLMRTRWSQIVISSASGWLLLVSLNTDIAVAHERAEVLQSKELPHTPTLIETMPFDGSSSVLSEFAFPQVHFHDAYLLHLRSRGGFSPLFIGTALMPARLSTQLTLPRPQRESFQHPALSSPAYPWMLSRGASLEAERGLLPFYEKVEILGSWSVWRSRVLRPIPATKMPSARE